MAKRLNGLGVDYEITDAVDGKTVDLSDLNGRLRQDIARQRHGRDLLPAEIGCYLSHYNLWQRLADEKIESAIIVEDDATFSADFFSIVAASLRMPYDWDVIILHTAKKKNGAMLYNIDDKYHIIRGNRIIAGTAGYLISASGVARLLKYCHIINSPIDIAYSEYWLNGSKHYAVYPRVVIEDETESTINSQPFSRRGFASKVWRRRQKIAIKIYNWRNPLPSQPKTP